MAVGPGGRGIALIVEDDVAQSELGAVMLREFDLEVTCASSAEEAIDVIAQAGGAVSIVLADVRLSGPMDGIALAHRVSVLWPAVSVIVTSGDPAAFAAELPEGAIFVPKPWRALDIVAFAEQAARADHTVHAVRL